MKHNLVLLTLALAAGLNFSTSGAAHKLDYAKDGSGVCGYKDTPVQPWSGYHTHDPDRPAPARVQPGEFSTQLQPGTAPADALVLFDGKDMAQWKPMPEWKLENGLLVAGTGNLATKEEFGDCQLHLEWQAPNPPEGQFMNQGNNGVLMMGMTEIQIFDSYTNQLYADGQAAAIYAQTPPLVNPCRKPGEWQTYDIVWTAPEFKDGKLSKPARVTMFFNGLLVHLNQEIYGNTPHRGLASYTTQATQGPIALMGHHCPVKFRNIWVRKLEPRKDILTQPK